MNRSHAMRAAYDLLIGPGEDMLGLAEVASTRQELAALIGRTYQDFVADRLKTYSPSRLGQIVSETPARGGMNVSYTTIADVYQELDWMGLAGSGNDMLRRIATGTVLAAATDVVWSRRVDRTLGAQRAA